MEILKSILEIFYPLLCLNCNEHLLKGEEVLCIICNHDLPLLQITDTKNNLLIEKFYGRVPLQSASAYLQYRKNNITQNLIQELKYRNNQSIGYYLGYKFAQQLKKSSLPNTIDFIVPVPLHKRKLRKRGYNQLTTFGKTLSNVLNIPYKPNILVRSKSSLTQTKKNREERFKDLREKFSLKDISTFKNKHILLIDDVVTTGATMEACWGALSKVKGIKISLASLALVKLD